MEAGQVLVGALFFVVLACSHLVNGSKVFNALREVDPPHKYPFMGWILIGKKRVKCGATLVKANAAVTSVSCVGDDIVSITFGDHSRTTTEGSEQVVTVRRTIVHPSYSPQTFLNDVAILVFDTNITETDQVAIVPLLPTDSLTSRILAKHMRVAGWGYEVAGSTDLVADQSDALQEITVDATACQSATNPGATGICYTPYRDPTAYPCEGDTGGPLIVKRRGIYHIAGIMSGWNVANGCQPDERIALLIPEVYTWLSARLATI